MHIKLSGVLCTILMMFLLLVPSGGEARQQIKPAEVSDDNRVYKLTEVDEKAIIDRKSFVSSSPSSMGCKEDAGLTRLIVVLRKTGKITDVALRDSSGCEKFDQRAINAAQKVKFKPAMKGGHPVSQYWVFEYTFTVTR